MSTKIIGGVVALVLVAGGAAYFVMNQPPASPAQGGATNTANTSENGSGAFQGSLADLMGRGGDWQCTFNVENEVSKSDGTVFVSGEKLRGDFASMVPQLNQTIDSHMIQSEGYVYVWTSLTTQGFKSKATLGTADGTTAFKDQGVDINQQYNYNCSPWTVDVSKFELPAGVTFAGA